MNVYVYGGKTRKSAYENITVNNTAAELGKVYNISAYRGLLVVAYPNEGKDTEFAYNFWAAYDETPQPEEVFPPAKWYEFEGKAGEGVFTTLVTTAIIMMVIICILCVVNCVLKCKANKASKQ